MNNRIRPFDAQRVRDEFPALGLTVHGKPLVYLDNAATSQKPRAVIDAIRHYYESENANVHRGVHHLSQVATQGYERARDKVRDFIGAAHREEIVWTAGTTESINIVARSFVRPRVQAGDEVLLTEMEHHSNIVPWQMLRDEVGIVIKVAPIDDDGALDMDAFESLLSDRTRFISVVHVSNSLGTINPVERIVALAKARKIPILLDGAQAVPHAPVDVQELGCDFYAFSGHKMFGPTGVGTLFGRRELLDSMDPWQGGGDMIKHVTFEKTIYNELPYRFEAGTPNIAGTIGLGAAIDWLGGIDREAGLAHEHDLLEHATRELGKIDGLRLIGTASPKAAVISFVLAHAHAHDVGQIVDSEGVAVRVGHHCTQPVMQHFGVAATARASFAYYNTHDDVERLVAAVRRVAEMFA